jgi:SPP1 gp7 family putative phage head morphogenesis protein
VATAPQPGAVPFDEAIRFFRDKLNIGTDTWRDLSAEAYATSFSVAGVRNMEVLQAIRVAIDRAIADGTTLEQFRTELRDIVARTGLELRGKFGWRSRIIFETNLRTAYAAGKWAQIERMKSARPYVRYVAVLDNRTRPAHRAWHGTVLPVDHPFWDTHYPPNGWGCRCTVQSLSQRDLARFGFTITDPAPPTGSLPRSIRGRDGNRIVELPPGIDEGWAHNVGKAERAARGGGSLPGWQAPLTPQDIAAPPVVAAGAATRPASPASLAEASAVSPRTRDAARRLHDALLAVDADLGAAAAANWAPDVRAAMAADFMLWAAATFQRGAARGEMRVIGVLTPQQLAEVRNAGRAPATAAVWIRDAELIHLARPDKVRRGQAIAIPDALLLPQLLAEPDAVLLDLQGGELLYIFTPLRPDDARRGTIVVRSGLIERRQEAGRRSRERGSGVITAGLVETRVLTDENSYRLISGSL